MPFIINSGVPLISFDDMIDCFNIQVLKKKGENWAVFGTYGEDFPKLRNVVIRDFQGDKIIIFTHNLSDKVNEILVNPKTSICWYSKKHSIQIQFYGNSKLIKSDSFKNKVKSLKDYIGPKPGTRYHETTDNKVHFCAIEFKIDKAVALKIDREGHTKFERNFLLNETFRLIP